MSRRGTTSTTTSSRSARSSAPVEDASMTDAVVEKPTAAVEAAPAPTRTKSQLDKTSELISSLKDAKSRDVEVVFAFDTTGSMYSHLAEVRKTLRETVTKLHKDVPNIRISIMAVGDYCDQSSSYVVSSLDLTKDLDAIVKFVEGVKPSGGGDSPEAYELALRIARTKISWTNGPHNKALVMIGDASPHAPSYTTEKIWWRDEVAGLVKMGVKIYGVQCGVDSVTKLFYEELASATGGVYLDLTKITLITDMFLAVCYREFGPEALEAYRSEAEKTSTEPVELRRMMSQLAAGPAAAGKKHKCSADWYALENDTNTTPQYKLEGERWVPAHGGLMFGAPAVLGASPVVRAYKSPKASRGRSPAKSKSKGADRSASPRKKASTSPKKSRRAARDSEEEEEEAEAEADAAPAAAMARNMSYAVGSGDWKRDRLGRMRRADE